ncbi:hypothetical protein HQ584_07935 [Patescibacteria group bacterium]|nr:hypothetical protein [Patescibacteria group bacterium]
MILNKTILILEDNLKVVSLLLKELFDLENDQHYDLSVILLTNYQQVEDYVNENPKAKFDIVLLDGDCKLNRSFHIFNIEKFGPEKVIAISSVPEYNEEAKQRGVERVVLKDMQYLEDFAKSVTKEVRDMISGRIVF